MTMAKLSAEEWAALLGALEAMRVEEMARWAAQPPTEPLAASCQEGGTPTQRREV